MARINLSNNNLSGSLPSSIGSLTRLNSLELYNNKISGILPYTIGRMHTLRYIYIYSNQFTGNIPDSVCMLNNLISFDIYNNNFTGKIPECLVQKPFFGELYMHNNQIEDLPDFSSKYQMGLTVYNNKLTFEDIEPNMPLVGFICSVCYQNFAPQHDSINNAIDTTVLSGSSFSMLCSIGGEHNIYQWTKNGIDIPWAVDSIITFDNVTASDSGVYSCNITNAVVPVLTFHRQPITLHVNPVSNIGINKLLIPFCRAYLNPTTNILNIEFTSQNSTFVKCKLINVIGSCIINQNLKDGKAQIDMSNLPAGIFILKIETANKVYDYKIVKQ